MTRAMERLAQDFARIAWENDDLKHAYQELFRSYAELNRENLFLKALLRRHHISVQDESV